jgi:release factor glutamine methyltransferase
MLAARRVRAAMSGGAGPERGAAANVASAESALAGSGLPRSEGLLLLARLLGVERSRLMAHPDTELSARQYAAARRWFERRRAGEPIAHLIEEREFYGRSLRVTPDVLIPRPETERLVELTLDRISTGARSRLLELGTGSGAVAISLAKERPGLEVVATDISEAALGVARENARRHGAAIDFTCGDWFDAVGDRQFDLIVSNPPYVAARDPHLARGDVRFEPQLALDGGEDGMDCIERIADRGRNHLASGGWLLLEHGYDQGDRCEELLHGLGYGDVADFPDLAGLSRVCVGCLRG